MDWVFLGRMELASSIPMPLFQLAFLVPKTTVPTFFGLSAVFFLLFLAAIVFLLSLRWPGDAPRI
jgi:hypothetical protein